MFVNGFESSGYQASLWNIRQTYDLSVASMGLFAADFWGMRAAMVILAAFFIISIVAVLVVGKLPKQTEQSNATTGQ